MFSSIFSTYNVRYTYKSSKITSHVLVEYQIVIIVEYVSSDSGPLDEIAWPLPFHTTLDDLGSEKSIMIHTRGKHVIVNVNL